MDDTSYRPADVQYSSGSGELPGGGILSGIEPTTLQL